MSLIQPGHIWVKSGSDPDYYPGQWVIQVSGTDPVSTLYHVYLNAYPMQPTGLYPAKQAVNITTTNSSSSGPLFPSQAECSMASDGQYARFDLPIANPPPTDIEPANNDDGFVFLQVSWYDCLEFNRVSTIYVDSSNKDILTIYSSVVTESGDIDNGAIDEIISGRMPMNCANGAMNNVTVRTACIQVKPNSNVTLQVELNPDSSQYNMSNELCSLSQPSAHSWSLMHQMTD